jgi:hypothetical protein
MLDIYPLRPLMIAQRSSEHGAALLTTLMVAALLLTAGAALILTTSISSTNAIDATAEAQAYYAAEAGLQESLNVLRGNVATPDFTFATAGDPAGGNKNGDVSPFSRLSKWLPYSSAYPDRVTLTSNYSPLSGLAYSVQVTHPDAEAVAAPGGIPGPDHFQKPGGSATPQPTPADHQWHCGHCMWDYSHHPSCQHKHCTSPNGTGKAETDDTRLLVEVIGYGPKGAVKQMKMLVKRTTFEYSTPAVTLMVGPADNSAPMWMAFTQDKDHAYSGVDKFDKSTTKIPAFGFTSSADQSAASTYIAGLHNPKAVDDVKTLFVSGSDSWLQTADDTRVLLAEFKTHALAMNRYFTTATPPAAGTYGTDATPVFTFVDGNFTVPDGKKGGGLLVVTGTLELQGTGSWDGLILVLGDDPFGNAARFKITGNKNAFINGALVIAPFHRTAAPGSPFLAPIFDNTLGGDTVFKYDSGEVRDAIYTLPPRVVGAHES